MKYDLCEKLLFLWNDSCFRFFAFSIYLCNLSLSWPRPRKHVDKLTTSKLMEIYSIDTLYNIIDPWVDIDLNWRLIINIAYVIRTTAVKSRMNFMLKLINTIQYNCH